MAAWRVCACSTPRAPYHQLRGGSLSASPSPARMIPSAVPVSEIGRLAGVEGWVAAPATDHLDPPGVAAERRGPAGVSASVVDLPTRATIGLWKHAFFAKDGRWSQGR